MEKLVMKATAMTNHHDHSKSLARLNRGIFRSSLVAAAIFAASTLPCAAQPNKNVPLFNVKQTYREIISTEALPPSADYPLGAVKQISVFEGVATHEGRITGDQETIFSFHPAVEGDVFPFPGGVIGVIEAFSHVICANGDELWWEALLVTPTPVPFPPVSTLHFEGDAVLVDGTGRFENGTGHYDLSITIFEDGTVEEEGGGYVSSVGTNKHR